MQKFAAVLGLTLVLLLFATGYQYLMGTHNGEEQQLRNKWKVETENVELKKQLQELKIQLRNVLAENQDTGSEEDKESCKLQLQKPVTLRSLNQTMKNNVRIVVGMTTLPSRIGHAAETVMSLLRQTTKIDMIYINHPEISLREKVRYEIPPVLRELERKGNVTFLKVKEDYGPITKLLPLLLKEKNPETIVVNVDDDKIYTPHHLEVLLDWFFQLKASSAVGFSARKYEIPTWDGGCRLRLRQSKWIYNPTIPLQMDILEGARMAMFLRGWFPLHPETLLSFQRSIHNESFFVDDIVIGAWLSSHGIARYVVPLQKKHCTGNNCVTARCDQREDVTSGLKDTNLGITGRNSRVFAYTIYQGHFLDKSVRTRSLALLNYYQILNCGASLNFSQ